METIAKRIKWKKYLLLIMFLSMLAVDVWEFYSLFAATKPDSLLYAIAFVILALALVLLIFTVLEFAKKSDAITLNDDKVVLSEYKRKTIELSEIKDVKCRLSFGGGRLFGGYYKSGTIEALLKNDEKIRLSDIADANIACDKLRRAISK